MGAAARQPELVVACEFLSNSVPHDGELAEAEDAVAVLVVFLAWRINEPGERLRARGPTRRGRKFSELRSTGCMVCMPETSPLGSSAEGSSPCCAIIGPSQPYQFDLRAAVQASASTAGRAQHAA